jgi:hypothetical protein
MRKNVGGADRAIRIIVGLFIISLAFWGPKSPWAYLGVIPLLTGVLSWCGLYTVLGLSTCQIKSVKVSK